MAKNLMVYAYAGTGKTTTMEWALQGKIPKGVTPSEEQENIIKAMKKMDRRKTIYMAFNNAIVDDAKGRMPVWCPVQTCNSFAYQAWLAHCGKDRPKMEKWKTSLLLKDVAAHLSWKERLGIQETVVKIVSLMKGTLTYGDDISKVQAMLDLYGVDYTPQELDYAIKVFDKSIVTTAIMDFDDQFFFPLHYDIPVEEKTLVVVDESQDLNLAKQRMAMKFAGKNGSICVIGDPFQSIYGFAGADPEAMNRMRAGFGDNVVVLPLTITRRCPKAVVRQANRWVPDLRAADDAAEGTVMNSDYDTFFENILTSDSESIMILCRLNAPIMGLVFKLIAKGRRAFIQGRDIGSGIINTVKKEEPVDISDVIRKFDVLTNNAILRESAKEFADQVKIEMLQDRNTCVSILASKSSTVADFYENVEMLFADRGKPGDIRASSVHRAKGLEAKHVAIYDHDKLPYRKFMIGAQAQQEKNLAYVADTRSQEILEYVTPPAEEVRYGKKRSKRLATSSEDC